MFPAGWGPEAESGITRRLTGYPAVLPGISDWSVSRVADFRCEPWWYAVSTVLTGLGHLPPALVYLLAAVLVAAETGVMLGLVLPGEATLLLVGFLAYRGRLELVPALLLMIMAGILGDALAFRSGRRHGPRLRASRLGRWVGEHRWKRADDMVNRLGGRAFLGGRWVAFVRTLAPRLAGSAGMRYRNFAPWAALGVATWAGTSVLVGYLAGDSYARVSRMLGHATGAVFGLLALLLVIALVGRWLGRNPDPVKAIIARIGQIPAIGRLVRRLDQLVQALLARLGRGWTLIVNLAIGVALLFGFGFALAALASLLVRYSGLSAVDGAVAHWFARHSSPGVTDATLTILSLTRGPVLITLVAVTAVVRGFWTRRWQRGLVTIVGTAGAFLPLVVLTVIARESAPDAGTTSAFLTTQAAVGTASICTLAWLLTRSARWGWAVTGWTLATGLIALLGSARLYVGFDTASSLASAMLLGGLWAVMFMLAWTGAGASGRPRPVRTLIGPPDLAGSTDPGQPGSDNGPAPGADGDPDDHRDRPDPDNDPDDHPGRPEPGGELDRRRGPRLAR
jgi:membrane protein DedA with SNARE-associated domain